MLLDFRPLFISLYDLSHYYRRVAYFLLLAEIPAARKQGDIVKLLEAPGCISNCVWAGRVCRVKENDDGMLSVRLLDYGPTTNWLGAYTELLHEEECAFMGAFADRFDPNQDHISAAPRESKDDTSVAPSFPVANGIISTIAEHCDPNQDDASATPSKSEDGSSVAPSFPAVNDILGIVSMLRELTHKSSFPRDIVARLLGGCSLSELDKMILEAPRSAIYRRGGSICFSEEVLKKPSSGSLKNNASSQAKLRECLDALGLKWDVRVEVLTLFDFFLDGHSRTTIELLKKLGLPNTEEGREHLKIVFKTFNTWDLIVSEATGSYQLSDLVFPFGRP